MYSRVDICAGAQRPLIGMHMSERSAIPGEVACAQIVPAQCGMDGYPGMMRLLVMATARDRGRGSLSVTVMGVPGEHCG